MRRGWRRAWNCLGRRSGGEPCLHEPWPTPLTRPPTGRKATPNRPRSRRARAPGYSSSGAVFEMTDRWTDLMAPYRRTAHVSPRNSATSKVRVFVVRGSRASRPFVRLQPAPLLLALPLTLQRAHAVGRATSQGHLKIFYLPETSLWPAAVSRLRDLGYEPAASDNPSRNNRRATFEVAYVSGTGRYCSERAGSRQLASAPTPVRRRVGANAPNHASTTTMQTPGI